MLFVLVLRQRLNGLQNSTRVPQVAPRIMLPFNTTPYPSTANYDATPPTALWSGCFKTYHYFEHYLELYTPQRLTPAALPTSLMPQNLLLRGPCVSSWGEYPG